MDLIAAHDRYILTIMPSLNLEEFEGFSPSRM